MLMIPHRTAIDSQSPFRTAEISDEEKNNFHFHLFNFPAMRRDRKARPEK